MFYKSRLYNSKKKNEIEINDISVIVKKSVVEVYLNSVPEYGALLMSEGVPLSPNELDILNLNRYAQNPTRPVPPGEIGVFADRVGSTEHELREKLVRNVPSEGHSFHIMGDIFQIEYHYIKSDDILPLYQKHVDLAYMLKDNQKGMMHMYTCIKEYFEGSAKIQKHLADYGKSNNAYPNKEMLKFFCPGCMLGKPKTKNYILTVIDTVSNEIKYWVTNDLVLKQIKAMYENTYSEKSIYQFFYDHDFLIKPADNNKIEFECVKTKYCELEGSALILNPRFISSTIVQNQLKFVNRIKEPVDKMFGIKKTDYFPAAIMNVGPGSFNIRVVGSKNDYVNHKYDYVDAESEENSIFSDIEL